MQPVYRIDAAHKLVRMYWDDFPSVTQLKEAVLDIIHDAEFEPGMSFLWDRKPGLPNPATIEYLREAVYFLEILAGRVGHHAWAIVAHSPGDFGKARMLEAMSDRTDVIVRAFQSSGDAEEWLRNPVRYDAVVHFPARNASLLSPGFACEPPR